jgi:hypothetical protein
VRPARGMAVWGGLGKRHGLRDVIASGSGELLPVLPPDLRQAVPCQNSHTVLSWCFLRSLGCSPVLADQALDSLPPLDPGGRIDHLAGLVQRRPLFPRLVGPVIVVVLRVLGQDLPEVLFAVDQQVVEALTA